MKSSKFKVRLLYTGPTLTRTPPPPYLIMGMWNGEKEVILFVKKKNHAGESKKCLSKDKELLSKQKQRQKVTT